MKKLVLFIILGSLSIFATSYAYADAVLNLTLPAGWKIIFNKETATSKVEEFVPANETAGQYSKIISQVSITKSNQNKTAFEKYVRTKKTMLVTLQCQVKALPNTMFSKAERPTALFSYECPKQHISGISFSLDGDAKTIFALSFEFKKDELNADNQNEIVELFKHIEICAAKNPSSCVQPNEEKLFSDKPPV